MWYLGFGWSGSDMWGLLAWGAGIGMVDVMLSVCVNVSARWRSVPVSLFGCVCVGGRVSQRSVCTPMSGLYFYASTCFSLAGLQMLIRTWFYYYTSLPKLVFFITWFSKAFFVTAFSWKCSFYSASSLMCFLWSITKYQEQPCYILRPYLGSNAIYYSTIPLCWHVIANSPLAQPFLKGKKEKRKEKKIQ